MLQRGSELPQMTEIELPANSVHEFLTRFNLTQKRRWWHLLGFCCYGLKFTTYAWFSVASFLISWGFRRDLGQIPAVWNFRRSVRFHQRGNSSHSPTSLYLTSQVDQEASFWCSCGEECYSDMNFSDYWWDWTPFSCFYWLLAPFFCG